MGSLYRMVHGVNPATFYFLPMLDKHPDEYPRFRDCFAAEASIQVLTRTGSCGTHIGPYEEENEVLRAMPGFIKESDWPEDNTYAVFEFSIPEQWKNDFLALKESRSSDVSPEYIAQLQKVYPKLADKFKEMFK